MGGVVGGFMLDLDEMERIRLCSDKVPGARKGTAEFDDVNAEEIDDEDEEEEDEYEIGCESGTGV